MKHRFALLWILLLSLLALPTIGEEGCFLFDSDNVYLELEGQLSGEVIVPSQAEDEYGSSCAVTAIGHGCFAGQHEIRSLTFEEPLQALLDGAISSMDGLVSVTLPQSLQVIGSRNFVGCGALERVTVPASVRLVTNAFWSCASLKEIRFEGECPYFTNVSWCFTGLPADCVILVPDDQAEAYRQALAENPEAASRVQPSGQNAIAVQRVTPEEAFAFDAATGTITGYPNGVDAFVRIPQCIGGVPVRAIGEDAFRGDGRVYGVFIPEGVERIGARAFAGASYMRVASFPSTLRSIGEEAFYNGMIEIVEWSEGLEEIGARAFTFLQVGLLDLPDSLCSIGESAFENAACTELYLGGNIEHIGSRAFAGTPLGYMAFDLYEMPEIAPDAFAGNSLADLDLPWDSSMENRDRFAALLAESCPNCTVWVNNPVSGGVAAYPENVPGITTIENGVWTAYHGDAADLTVWTDYDSIPVTALGDGLFKGNQTIRSFYPHHCGWFTTIGSEAFADSSVSCVEMFGSITTLGDGAFRNCVNITELTLPASLEQIGTGVFDGCTGLKKLTVLCDPLLLPQDMASVLAGIEEVYAAPDATKEQVRTLSALAGRAWNAPVPRVGEEQAQQQAMPFEPMAAGDFWVDEEASRLDSYRGYELNLVLPREIDGVALSTVGASMMTRSSRGDNGDVELPVRSLVIPETYTEIPMYALQNCETLETVICYAPLERLEEGVFSGCTSLREVVFVNGVRSVDRYVFDECVSLETVYLGPYVEEISEYAFLNTDQTPAFEVEACLTDPAQMPDVETLLEAVRSDPMPTPSPTATPAPAVPVGEAGAPYIGLWTGVTMEMEGQSFALADFSPYRKLRQAKKCDKLRNENRTA